MKSKITIGLVAVLVSAGAFAVPKTIVFGWDTGRLTVSKMLEKADELDKLPIDGFVLPLNMTDSFKDEHNGYLRASCKRVWPRDELVRHFVPLFRKAVKHRSLASSFVGSMFQPVSRMAWDNDKEWASFAENMRTLAVLARSGGLKGILLDTEDYWRSGQYVYRPSDKMTYEEACALARRRGREVFKGVFEEFPDIDVITLWWLSIRYEYFGAHDAGALAKSLGDLLPAFTDGVLDVMTPGARLFDGNEHTYHWSHWRSFVAQRAFHPLLVSPENRRKFRAQTWVSSAFYLDMFINPAKKADGTPHPFYMGPVGGRRLNRFLDRYEDASMMSEDYIWMFGEKRSWVDWGEFEYCKGYEAAYTNGLWETALPGFSEELAILKDPRGRLLPRLKAMRADGTAVDVAGETVKDGKRDYVCDVNGVRYGEWYAVCVEAESEYPGATVGLFKGKYQLWDRSTAAVDFARPGREGWRRGIAFQRIWGGADRLRVRYSCGMKREEAKNVKIRVYRVFSPEKRENEK